MNNSGTSGAFDIAYMARTRAYYRAQGYSTDYQWAHYSDVPFTLLAKPLADCRVAVITTAMPDARVEKKQRGVVSTPSAPVPGSLYTDDLAWDRDNTHTRDVGSFLPLAALRAMQDAGKIGALAPRFHSVPTEYSQRNTINNDAPEILARCREDKVDLALLTAL